MSENAEGRSTLAALVSKALKAEAIPVTVVDYPPGAGDAHHLEQDSERYNRNMASIGGRETAMRRRVRVETCLVSRTPEVNISGDHNRYVWKVIEAIRAGDVADVIPRMKNAFVAYGKDITEVVRTAVGMGFLSPSETVALHSTYEAVYLWVKVAAEAVKV